MTSSRIIEEERGTWTGHAHPHNGYDAGGFGSGSIGAPRSATRLATAPATHPAAA